MVDASPRDHTGRGALINDMAEQALLGALLTKPQLLSALPSAFSPEHYGQPAHEDIHRVLVEVGKPGIPAAVAVAQALAINDPEGRTRIAGLLSAVVSYLPGSIAQYADLVTDMHRRRALVGLAAKMHESAFALTPDGSADGAIAQAMAGLDHLVSGRASNRACMSLDEAMDLAILRADEAAKRQGPAGLSTGFNAVDEMTGGLEDGTLTVLAGRPAMGKAQPLDAKVLRRDGTWARMGDLRMGDDLASVDGAPSRIMAVHPRGERDVFTVTLADGRATKVCGDHLWRVTYREWSGPLVISTHKLRSMLGSARYKNRLSIDLVSGHFGASVDLPLDAYVLGVMLGDGSFRGTTTRITSADPEIVAAVAARLASGMEIRRVVGSYAYSVTSGGLDRTALGQFVSAATLPGIIAGLGLDGTDSGNKFIPARYLAATRQDRLDLLRGLMDTDGWAEKHGSVRFTSASLVLAEGVRDLVRSLGGTCSIVSKAPFCTVRGKRVAGAKAWVCRIRHAHAETLFLLARKSERAKRGHNATVRLTVSSVELTGHEPVQCITVTHPSSLYVTDGYTVTHNSAIGHQMALAAARQGVGVLEISLEMSGAELGRRALSAASGVPLGLLKRGRHGAFTHQIIQARRNLANLPVTIEDGGGLTAAMIALKARQAQRRHGLGLIMVDHLHIVRPDDGDARQGATWAVGRISGAMKRLAKEFACPVLLLAQLNRGVEGRDDKRPGLSDLRQSGDIEQDADAVGFVYRAEYYLAREPEMLATETREQFGNRRTKWEHARQDAAGKADLIFAKVRDGAPGTVPLLFHGETTSFSEPAHGQ